MERHFFKDADFLQTLFDAAPSFMFIVDADVRIHHLNAAALSLLNTGKENILLKRGGEVLHCVHSSEVPEGCGHAPACRHCVVRNSVVRAFNGEHVNRETAKMELFAGGQAQEVYLSVTATPFGYSGEELALLVLEDVTAQKRAENALRQSEQWLAITLRSIGDAVVATDGEGRIRFMNPVAEGLMGWKLEDIKKRKLTEVFNIVNKDTRRPVENPVEKVILQGGTFGLANHTVLIARDGNEIPIDDSAAPIKNDAGDILGVILVFRDVTERDRAEEELRASAADLRTALQEKETLLKELYHRTKNNMNVISSLLALQMKAAKDSDIACPFEEMQSRIRAMALVHEKLYKSRDLHNLDMRDYIEDLAISIHKGFGSAEKDIRLKLDIQSVPFPIDQAIPCGLIINELMSNAMKYAFTDSRSGQIAISLHALEGDQIELVFSDDGKGLPDGMDVKDAQSLGLRIVHTLAERQLGGRLECESVLGTKYRICFAKTSDGGGGA